MSSSTSNSKLGRSLFIVGIAIASFTFLDRAADSFVADHNANETFMLYGHHQKAIAEGVDASIVFVGDSSVRASIDPLLFERLYGKRAVNLGLVSEAGLAGDYYLLRDYLRQHPAPEVVVLGHLPKGPAPDFPRGLYLNFFTTITESWRLWRAEHLGALDAVEGSLRAAIPMYRQRDYIKSALLPKLLFNTTMAEAMRKTNQDFQRERQALGYLPAADKRATHRQQTKGSGALSAVNLEFLRRIEALLPQSTQIMWLIGPTSASHPSPPVDALRAQLQPRVKLIFVSAILLADQLLPDGVHTTRRGAQTVTTSVAAALAKTR